MANWKINCMEKKYPGLWHTWFREQIVAVDWPPDSYGLSKQTNDRGWLNARRNLKEINPGDKVVVQLKDWRVGRIGTVLSKKIEDLEWKESVPRQGENLGQMGRRIQVRWDLLTGPLTASSVAILPPEARPNPGIWRPTLRSVPDKEFERIEKALSKEENWVSLVPGFAKERALSEYICASPHLIEDGLVPFPSADAREMVFPDGTRLDVLLLDKDKNIVIVECKQGIPRLEDVAQLRRYMKNAQKLVPGTRIGPKIRGILVHGGARKLSREVRNAIKPKPQIELVQFSVSVEFTPSR